MIVTEAKKLFGIITDLPAEITSLEKEKKLYHGLALLALGILGLSLPVIADLGGNAEQIVFTMRSSSLGVLAFGLLSGLTSRKISRLKT